MTLASIPNRSTLFVLAGLSNLCQSSCMHGDRSRGMAAPSLDHWVETSPKDQAFIDYYAEGSGRSLALTTAGHEVRPLPSAVFAWLQSRIAQTWGAPGHPCFSPEHATPAQFAASALVDARWGETGLPADGETPTWVNRSDAGYSWLLLSLQSVHERWAGIPLVPTQFYGPRVYLRNAVLNRHIDIPDTHVVSSSITISYELDEPWPLILERGAERIAIDLAPGEMLLYEGSRLPHYRPRALVGKQYINLYLHYRPRDGRFERERGWVL